MKNYGLQPLPKDRRDYSNRLTFGSFNISELPDEYILNSTILNQGGTFKCTAYTACAIQESQHTISFDPDWFYEQEGIVAGKVSEFGYDLRTQMRTGVKKGFRPLTEQESPEKFKDDSFFSIDGFRDLFDNIRVAMWLGKDEKRCASLGCVWYNEFEGQGGIVPLNYKNPAGLHNVKCCGWKKIGAETYLVIQNSYGTSAGDNGLYYFPRSVVNKVFTVGAYVWRATPDPEQIKTISILVGLISRLVTLMRGLYFKNVVPDSAPLPPPAPSLLNNLTEAKEKKLDWWELPPEKQSKKYANYPTNLKAVWILKTRQICKTQGLTSGEEQELIATIQGESGFNPYCVNESSKDYGLCQFSARYYLKEYGMTPDYCVNHPEKCITIMAKNWKTRKKNWIAFTNGGYRKWLLKSDSEISGFKPEWYSYN